MNTRIKLSCEVPGGIASSSSSKSKAHPASSDIAEALAQSRFLRGLSEDEVRLVLNSATHLHMPENTTITTQGTPADRLFIVRKGTVRYFFLTETGRKLLLMWLGPGEPFGGTAMLDASTTYVCGTETTKDCQLLMWERSKLRGLIRQCPQLLQNCLAIATDYFIWYISTHVALTCSTAPERVAQVLYRLCIGMGRAGEDGITLDITNEQLANASNVTLFTMSRLMAAWHRRGIIEKSRGHVILRQPAHLLAFGQE